MFSKVLALCAALFVFAVAPMPADNTRRAAITGSQGPGRCTIDVIVDGSAVLEVTGASANLTTISGQEAVWNRFTCSAPLPRTPGDFTIDVFNARGRVRLEREPRANGGSALIRIDDPKGGRARYVFALSWRSGDHPRPSPFPPHGGQPYPGPPVSEGAIRYCQDAVRDRLSRDGYSYPRFLSATPQDSPGPNNMVRGKVSGRRGYEEILFSYSCSMDFDSGRLRSVDVVRR